LGSWDDARQIVAQYGRAPSGLDVLDDQFSAARMADERPLSRIAQGVGQVADQHYHEPEPRRINRAANIRPVHRILA